jgi:hypothetical protein
MNLEQSNMRTSQPFEQEHSTDFLWCLQLIKVRTKLYTVTELSGTTALVAF